MTVAIGSHIRSRKSSELMFLSSGNANFQMKSKNGSLRRSSYLVNCFSSSLCSFFSWLSKYEYKNAFSDCFTLDQSCFIREVIKLIKFYGFMLLNCACSCSSSFCSAFFSISSINELMYAAGLFAKSFSLYLTSDNLLVASLLSRLQRVLQHRVGVVLNRLQGFLVHKP